MSRLRATHRTMRLFLHVVLGVLLTPLVLSRHGEGGLRTHPKVASWWHNRLADILAVRITVSGYRPQAPALLVSNHVSWLDIVVLGSLTHTDFLSKHEVRRWPVVGWLAAMAGTLFIRRGTGEAGQVSEQIARRLRGRGILTLFPEGTTTDGRDVRPFFSRLFAAAVDTRTDVVPVALRYHIDGEHDPVAPYIDSQSIGDNLGGLLQRPQTEVRVVFGEPIEVTDQSRKTVAEQAHSAITSALRGPDMLPLGQRVVGTATG